MVSWIVSKDYVKFPKLLKILKISLPIILGIGIGALMSFLFGALIIKEIKDFRESQMYVTMIVPSNEKENFL